MLALIASSVSGQEQPSRLSLTDGWAALWFNTGRAYSDGTGAVWTGRGVTAAASAVIAGQLGGRVTYALNPIAFVAENAAYRPSASTIPDGTRSPWIAEIDMPFRFGTRPYARVDAGESFVRADVLGLAAGVSNEAQRWGPGRLHPLLMSGQAGGFRHAFIERNRPLPIGVGWVTGRWLVGQLAPSGYGPAHEGTKMRTLVGAVATITPYGMRGLELGGGRVFHLYESPVSYDIRSLTLPISALLKNRVRSDNDARRETNQLASVFFRVAPPKSHVEVYGEFLRDDHNVDLRDLIAEPDHDAAYMLGVRREWRGNDSTWTTMTLERSNGRLSHLASVRAQAPMYAHFSILEGHTHRGRPLGDAALMGGGEMTMILERTRGDVQWSVIAGVALTAQNSQGGTWDGSPSGGYTLGVRKEWRRSRRGAEILVLPTFGDVRGFDVRVRYRVSLERLAT